MSTPPELPRRHPDRRVSPRRWRDKVLGLERKFIYGVPAVLLTFALLFGLWAFWLEPDRLVVRRADIALPDWPAGPPLRVAALSDIHGGAPYMTVQKLHDIVALTNRQKPDLIVLLGDYVILGVLGGHFMDPETVADNLRGLTAPLGVYAVLGNHDWWYNGPRVQAALTRAGYRVLEDDIARVSFHGTPLWIAGLGDEWTRRPDVKKVMDRVPPGAPVLVLTHGPDLFPQIPAINGLTLAAHTHGGQVRLPFMGAPLVPSRYRQRYLSGLVEEGTRRLFVTSGLGTSILPVRFRTPPEIALLTLHRAGEKKP